MSVSTFAGIKTAVVDWLDATAGGGLTTTIVGNDIFPQMQAMMYMGHGRDIPPLRIRAMIDSATITPASGGTFSIASECGTGFLEFLELVPTTAGAPSLNYMDPWQFRKQTDYLQATSGDQYIYTVEGATVYLAPASVTMISAKWYEKFTALSGDSDTDHIILYAPHVYMDGCLYLACEYVGDDRAPMYRQKFAAGIHALNMTDRKQRASAGTPFARPRSVA